MGGKRVRAGRRRIPTAIKLLRGAKIRHDVTREVQGLPGVPPMPEYLRADPLAVAAWDRYAVLLCDLRVLTTAHALPLALLAETVADLERMAAEWAQMGRRAVLITEWVDPEGTIRHRIMANPLVRMLRGERLLLLQIAGEFGLTPATASKVLTHEGGTDPAFDAFLKGPRVVAFNKPRRSTRRKPPPPGPSGDDAA